ncbi:MAG TPA: hypothetical protein VMX54_05215 [Vicinamibacteria bacterium]|nr:hypothetical protein [Vicinamibacteria bacterium]
MTGYLGRLVDRAVGRAAVLEPRLPSRFDPGRIRPSPSPEQPWAAEIEAFAELAVRAPQAAPGPASPGPGSTAGAPADRSAPAAEGRANREAPGAREPLASRPPPASPPGPAQRAGEAGEEIHARLRGAAEAAERLLVEARRERTGAGREIPAAEPRPAPAVSAPKAIALEPRRPAELAAAPRPDHPLAPRAPTAPPPLHVPGRTAARQAPAPRAPAPEPPPVVHVTIGRVEVRAEPPAVAPPARAPRRPAAHLALEDYLRRRNGGGG